MSKRNSGLSEKQLRQEFEMNYVKAYVFHMYIRARAAVEGMEYDLTPEFFLSHLATGCGGFCGVTIGDKSPSDIKDEQEPHKGFIKEFLSSKEMKELTGTKVKFTYKVGLAKDMPR